jgi:predicted glycosyltransferase
MTNASTSIDRATDKAMPPAEPEPGANHSQTGAGPVDSKLSTATKRVWIDIDNSPHVPFFLPIIAELKAQGVEVTLTARNMYQVVELLEFFHLPCKVIGRHYGKNKVLKVAGNCLRALELVPTAAGSRPNLAISHGSRAQLLISKAMRIPTMMLHDYEHSTKTGFIESDWVMMPDVIPDGAMSKKRNRVLRYPGLKEDVYVPGFRPDPSLLSQLGIASDELVVAVRPPATEAHYHNPESEVLFAETMRFLSSIPKVRAVTLPRNGRQGKQLQADWPDLIADGRMLIPSSPVDGLNLIWFSDLVVSGGGTMNREAAALGVPVYSIFRGKIGAVDRYLAEQGRMTLIESVGEVRTKIKVCRWDRPAQPESRQRPALDYIVGCILSVLAAKDPQRSMRPQAPTSPESKISTSRPSVLQS